MRNILFRTSLIVSLVLVVSVPAFAQMKIGDSPTSITTGAQLDIEKSGSRTVFMDTGKVGIGDTSPASLLTVGSGDLFQVDSTGNIVKINNVTTSFPSSQGSAGTILTNNGSGTLTWSAPAGISADSLNFTDLSDSLLLDASTDIFSSGTNVLSVTNSGTGLSFRVNDDGTTTDSTPFVVDASGNVGIGDTTPAALLTVGSGDLFQVNSSGSIAAVAGITMTSGALSIPNGDLGSGSTLRFKNASNANDGAIYETNGNHLMIHSGAANSIVLRDSSSNYGAWFNFGGNGFTFYNNYDDAALRGALTFYRYRSSATAPAAGFGTFLDFNLEGYTNGTQVGTGRISSLWENTQTNDTTDRDAALTFSTTADNSSSERMRIASGGNVGIGNTNPTFKLDVLSGTINTGTGGYGANPGALAVTAPDLAIGAAGGSMLFTSNSDFGIDKGGSIALGGRYATGSANDTIFAKVKGAKETAGTSNQGGYLAFATFNHNAGAIAERARIDSSGNLGIGTTSPAGKVQVVTTSDTTPDTVTAWDARHLTVGATGSTGGGVGISYDQTNNRGYISALTPNTAWRDVIIGAGTANVGIGMTTAPAAKLDVNGTVRVGSFGTSSATTLCHTSNIIALCTSSARYKENIQNMITGMDVIKKLRPVTFKWKARDEQSVGFIAEDVQKVDPRLTFNNDKGQVEGVHYQLITSYLTKAMQELSVTTDENTADIKELKKENAEMKAEISDLKTRLDQLEEKLK